VRWPAAEGIAAPAEGHDEEPDHNGWLLASLGRLTVLTALILICSAAIAPDLGDCTHQNAMAVIRIPAEFGHPATCFMHGSAYLAETSLAQELSTNDRVKVICVRSETNSGADATVHEGERAMTKRIALLVAWAAAIILVAGGVHAESIEPIEGKSIDLGTFGGVAYYTLTPDGYRLVVTLMPSGADTPVRFVATLAPGQSVTLSTPRKLGEPAVEIHFQHQGESLFVDRTDPRLDQAAD
jgi:hypothetical protein